MLLLPSSAAAASYTEDWTVTSWRVARIHSTALIYDGMPGLANYRPSFVQTSASSQVFCLGPASWRVQGVIDGRSYTENWTAADWLDTTDGYGIPWLNYNANSDGITASYETQSSCDNSSGFAARPFYNYEKCTGFRGCVLSNPNWRAVQVPGEPYMVIPTGMYGGLVTYFGHYFDLDWKWGRILYKMGLRSIPQKWQVTGSL